MATIYGLAISAQATFNMHSLNNEGGEGNQIQTRMVNVTGAGNKLYQVNAISGDMFKHILSEHLFRLARDADQTLCAGCAKFDANRISADDSFQVRWKSENWTNVQAIDAMLRACLVDDLEGILITSKNTKQGRGKAAKPAVSDTKAETAKGTADEGSGGGSAGKSVPRKSVVEFGWVVGIPKEVRTDQYFHVKYNPQSRSQDEVAAGATTGSEAADRASNQGQAIFHRPASSGNYAIIANLDVARIGYNDISQQYALDESERALRLRLLLQSLLHTFAQPNGAMRNTQMPHLVNLEGVISVSRALLPAPTVSPLNPSYQKQIEDIKTELNRLAQSGLPGTAKGQTMGDNNAEVVELHQFSSLAEFTQQMVKLMVEATPYRFATR